jgi:acrylyl-CoA reductase (NADPH)
VALLGVESVLVPPDERQAAWERIARDLPTEVIERTITTIGMGDIAAYSLAITNGQVRGRVVIDVNA